LPLRPGAAPHLVAAGTAGTAGTAGQERHPLPAGGSRVAGATRRFRGIRRPPPADPARPAGAPRPYLPGVRWAPRCWSATRVPAIAGANAPSLVAIACSVGSSLTVVSDAALNL